MDPRSESCKCCVRFALTASILLAFAGLDAPSALAKAEDPPPVDSRPSPASEPDRIANLTPAAAAYQAATQHDQIGRIVVPVMVNGTGPYLFVLDTGATSTVLTPQLVATLGLQSASGDVTMNGATGSAIVSSALVERIAAGDVVLENQQLPVANDLVSGVDGVLGVDALGAKRVMVDFDTGKIEIRDARQQRPLAGT